MTAPHASGAPVNPSSVVSGPGGEAEDSRPPQDDTAPREGICKRCDKPIVFEPFVLDGKWPNPPVWFHTGGGKTCSTIPFGWTDPGWPLAAPKEPDHG